MGDSTKAGLRCQCCDGNGTVLLMNSWFTADGFREQRCSICRGSGRNPSGFTAWGDQLSAQRRFRALRADARARASGIPVNKGGDEP